MPSTEMRTPPSDAEQRRPRWQLLTGPVASLIVGITVLVLSQDITEPSIATGVSPRWWPQILGAIICVLSVAVAVKVILVGEPADEDALPATLSGTIRVTAVIATTFAYGVLWYFLDFRVATFVLVAALAFIIGGRGWKVLLLFPALVTAVLYVVFVLALRVPL